MQPDDLESLLTLTLGPEVASDVAWESAGDPRAAVDLLNRRASALGAPYRQPGAFDDNGFGRAIKEITRLRLVARLLDELAYELDPDLGVELVRS
jgi:hypothetical protein